MTAAPTWQHTGARFTVKVGAVGYTRDNRSGCGSGTWQRWALVPTLPDGRPALHWRDGKARHVGPRVSGKAAPAWLHRAMAYCQRVGPMSLHELDAVATWFRANPRGEPDLVALVVPF